MFKKDVVEKVISRSYIESPAKLENIEMAQDKLKSQDVWFQSLLEGE